MSMILLRLSGKEKINNSNGCSLFHIPYILIILNIPVKRLSPHFDSIICPLLKLLLRHFLFEVAGIVCLVCLVVHVPDWVGL